MGEIDAAPKPAAPIETKSALSAGANEIALSDISRNPAQPRRSFDETALQELASSLREKGVLQAILVRSDPKAAGKYQIIAGERRWRAAKIAGLKTIPAIVREMDELELLEVGIIENVQRADLNAIEEAEAYEALMKRFGRTQDSMAKSVGKSRAHIANTLRLLQLPESARRLVRTGAISAGHARAALASNDPAGLAQLAASKGLSVRDVESLAKGQVADAPAAPKSLKRSGDAKDVDTEALERDVERILGLSVDIRHAGDKGGEVRIKYKDLEQLDDVCRRLTAKRN
jgi:ParB family chromosome partitioning protein